MRESTAPRLKSAVAGLLLVGVLACGAAPAFAAGPDGERRPEGQIEVSRISGVDRYEVALNVAKQFGEFRLPTVFVASGESFPDALSATPVARMWRAPLFLVTRDTIPTEVAAAIESRRPVAIKVVGGPATISPEVLDELAAIAPDAEIERYDGADRYEVSRNMAGRNSIVLNENGYVATGTNFADALSAGAVAGELGSPLVLVDGSRTGLDDATRQTLRSLSVTDVTVVGGANSISPRITADISTIAPVVQAAGIDRYATAVAANRLHYSRADSAYLATGLNFPDALTGGLLAATNHAPLYVVPGTCVPQTVLDEFTRLGVTKVVLVGGPASLSDGVFQLKRC